MRQIFGPKPILWLGVLILFMRLGAFPPKAILSLGYIP